MTLDFYKPMKGHSFAEYSLQPKDGGTEVTWAMYGPQPYLGKVMCLFFNMDKMVGGQFEHGLAQLKTLAEK